MGWEAIERYLIEAEQEVKYFDQQVPQMIVEDQKVMQQTTDYYTEEFMYNKPVQVCGAVEQTINRDEPSDLYDLDQEDNTFYPQENIYTNCDIKPSFEPVANGCTDSFIYTTSDYIKPEPISDFPDCAVRNCSSANSYVCSDNVEDQYMTMKSKILDVCIKDVEETCKYLKISPDPHQWTPDNVQQWIGLQCGECGAKQPNIDNFYMSGIALCSMTEEKFKILAPESGSALFYRLVIWRNVVEQKMSKSYQTLTPPSISYIPVPRSPSLPPSPDSVSSNPAMLSDTESQPSSPHCTSPSYDTDRLPEEPVNHHRQTIQLWQFLKLLLLDGHFNDCIRWVDRSRGIFKIENSSRVAKLWGKRKNRPQMNYDKLSRSIRQYYRKNIIKKTEHSKRLVYQFCNM